MKISRQRNGPFLFISVFVKGAFYMYRSMEIGIIEGAIASIIEHYITHFDL